jgi:hypothetical protein
MIPEGKTNTRVNVVPPPAYHRNLDYRVILSTTLFQPPFQITPLLTSTANSREQTMAQDKTKKCTAPTEDNVPAKKMR